MSTVFTNSILNVDHSKIESPTKTHLADCYAMVTTAVSITFWAVLLMLALCILMQPFWPVPQSGRDIAINIIVGASIIIGLLILFKYFAEKAKGYCVREQDITLFKGLIFKNIITQPICRIQHIEVKRGPIDRKVGLAKLHVYSAGDISQTFEIPGLALETANSIRNQILAHKEMQHHG